MVTFFKHLLNGSHETAVGMASAEERITVAHLVDWLSGVIELFIIGGLVIVGIFLLMIVLRYLFPEW